jgi:UDP-N-acetylenolpyruvoylglucosamine reductase
MPKRDVEQGYFFTNLLSSNSETVCREMLTVKMNCVGSIFNRPQVARQASGILFWVFKKRRFAQPEVTSAAALINEIRTRQLIFSQATSCPVLALVGKRFFVFLIQ